MRSPKIGNTFGAYKDGNSYHNQSFDSLLFCFFFLPYICNANFLHIIDLEYILGTAYLFCP